MPFLKTLRNPNLLTRLLFWFVLVGLLPLTIVTYLNYTAAAQALELELTHSLAAVADAKADQISLYSSERLKDVTILSRQSVIADAIEEFDLAFRNSGVGSEEYETVSTKYRGFLIDYAQGYEYENLFLVSAAGDAIFSVQRGEDLGSNYYSGIYNQTELAHVFEQSQTLLTAEISDFAYYPPTNEPAAFVASPVMKDDVLIGALILQINNNSLYSVVNDYTGLDRTGETVVGQIAGDKIYFITPLRHDPYAAFRRSAEIGSDDSVPLQEAVRGVAGSGDTVDYRGKEVVANWQYLPSLRWGMVVKIDTEEAFASIADQRDRSISLAAISLFGVLFVAILVARSISSPVVNLTNVAERIAEGEIDIQAKVETSDEIGTLAGAFNVMTAQLREFIATLEQRVAERTKAQETVAEIATAVATIPDLQEMLERMVHLTQRGFGLYHAHVFSYYEDTQELRIVACGYQEGDEHEGTHGMTSIPFGQEQSLVARAARNREAVIVNDVRNEPGWLPNPLLPDTRAELAVPLVVGDTLLGVLDVQAAHLDAFTNAEANIQTTLAAQIATSMQNLLQFESTQKVAADLSVVAEVGIATATITDKDQLLQEVVDLSKKSFNLYHAHIYLMNEAGDALDLTSGAGEVGRTMVAQGLSIALDREQSLVARAARTHEGVVVNDVTQDANFLPNPLLPETRAEMAVPMIVAGKVLGVLDVQAETVGRFTDLAVNIQTTLASQIAVALENARSFEKTEGRAEQALKLNTITQKIQAADTIEEAMQVAARELGHALGKRQTMVSLNPSALKIDSERTSNE